VGSPNSPSHHLNDALVDEPLHYYLLIVAVTFAIHTSWRCCNSSNLSSIVHTGRCVVTQGLVDCLETGRIVVDIRCRYWILKGQFGEIENDSMHPKPNTHHLTCGLVPPRIYHANESSLLLLPLSSSLKQGNSFIYNKGMESKW
jgi:hypothetical protein